MKESNKRIISGLVFGGLFISSLYTHVSFAILTFIFGIISTNEFNKLRKKSLQERLKRQSVSMKNKNFYILISLGLYDNKKLLPTLVNTLSKLNKINIILATSSECQTLRELKEISKKY